MLCILLYTRCTYREQYISMVTRDKQRLPDYITQYSQCQPMKSYKKIAKLYVSFNSFRAREKNYSPSQFCDFNGVCEGLIVAHFTIWMETELVSTMRLANWHDPIVRQSEHRRYSSYMQQCTGNKQLIGNAQVVLVVVIMVCVRCSKSQVSSFSCYTRPPSDTECQ